MLGQGLSGLLACLVDAGADAGRASDTSVIDRFFNQGSSVMRNLYLALGLASVVALAACGKQESAEPSALEDAAKSAMEAGKEAMDKGAEAMKEGAEAMQEGAAEMAAEGEAMAEEAADAMSGEENK